METLYGKYKDKGLRITAFPANNFGGQEPRNNEQIKRFCSKKFKVSFDLFAKVSVAGDDQCDLYKFLTDEKAAHGFGGPVAWNFQKYLADRDGKIIAKFSPRDLPESEGVVSAIEKALGAE